MSVKIESKAMETIIPEIEPTSISIEQIIAQHIEDEITQFDSGIYEQVYLESVYGGKRKDG